MPMWTDGLREISFECTLFHGMLKKRQDMFGFLLDLPYFLIRVQLRVHTSQAKAFLLI